MIAEQVYTCQQLVLGELLGVLPDTVPVANGEILDQWLRWFKLRRYIVPSWCKVPTHVDKCAAIFYSKKHLHGTHLGIAQRTPSGYSLSYADDYGDPLFFEYYEAISE